ncbi:Uncharacterized protein EJ110_NYTH44046 [Nymphaea thermarum]|nr:Uncharacterized protein EJ110_NYTH44046 [Nymphaea thermarum]
MGSCISGQKRFGSSAKQSQSVEANANGIVEEGKKGETRLSSDGSSRRDRNYGSKDEAFFDSLAWLESDCDEDFVSVCGDFTPSRGNTWNHQGSSPGTGRPTLASIVSRMSDAKEQASPTDNKKRLEDLFRETKDNDEDVSNVLPPLQSLATDQQFDGKSPEVEKPNAPVPLKALIATPSSSEANSTGVGDTTPNGIDSKIESRKASKGSQCCMPNLLPSFSFNEKKKLSSPIAVLEK